MKKFFGFFIIICFSINANTSFSTLPACKGSDCKDKRVVYEEKGFSPNPNQPNTYSSPIQVVEFLNILPRINKIGFPNF